MRWIGTWRNERTHPCTSNSMHQSPGRAHTVHPESMVTNPGQLVFYPVREASIEEVPEGTITIALDL